MSGSPADEAAGFPKAAARMSGSSAGGSVGFPSKVVGSLSGMGVCGAFVVTGPLAHSSRVSCLGIVPSRTTSLVKVVKGLIAHLNFVDVSHQMVWLVRLWQIGLFSPILQGLCICQGFPWLSFPVVMAGNCWIQDQQECLPANTLWGRLQ